MVLRKPYAFFIKMFKPIHIFLALSVAYLMYLENKILNFFSNYISTTTNVVGQSIKENLVSPFIYIIPIIIISFSLLILIIMFKKKKPLNLYVVNIFSYIVVIAINIYAIKTLGVLENTIVDIRIIKLIHDLVLINMLIETTTFIFLIIRGIGINFKKFDFDSEIAKFDINESDKEEFELSLKFDFDESKKKSKKLLRNLKYTYLENKFIINLSSIIGIIIITTVIVSIILFTNKPNKEGVIYSIGNFNLIVDNTSILNTGYNGSKITKDDNFLVVVSVRLNSNYLNNSLYSNDFSLIIGDNTFKSTNKYDKYLLDIGDVYNEENLKQDFENYLFVFDVPSKYKKSEMKLRYNNQGDIFDIKLNPKAITNNDVNIQKNITEKMDFSDSIGKISFNIKSFEINDRFYLEYNFCVKENECILSKEYIKASIDQNYDKYVLKLDVDYNNESSINLSTFYDFLSNFGSIGYKIGDKWYYQEGEFEKLSPKKGIDKYEYIGINSIINNADSIKLIFNIRGRKYEYILK